MAIPAEVQAALATLDRRLRELETSSNRVRSEVRAEVDGIIRGIESHVDQSLRTALAPYLERLSKLDSIHESVTASLAMAEEARRYRLEREVREKIERERIDRTRASLDEAELARRLAENADAPFERSHRRRNATIGVVVSILIALAGLLGAMVGSHH